MRVFGVMIAHNARNFELARVFTREIPFAEGARHGVKESDGVLPSPDGGADRRSSGRRRGPFGRGAGEALGHNLWALYFHFLVRWLGSGRRSPDSIRPSLREMLEVQATRRTRRLAKAVFAFAKFFMGDAAAVFAAAPLHCAGFKCSSEALFSPA